MTETSSTVRDVQSRPMLINLAPTGMVPTRDMSSAVPLTTSEIVRDVLACAEIGISIVHLHVREDDGRPTLDKERYARVIGGIRDVRDDLIICVSCSGRGGATLEQRSSVLTLAGDLKPDMASLTLSSLNFATQASVNSPDTVQALARRMRDAEILPELEVFDLGMANYATYLLERGILRSPAYANILLGGVASSQARLLDIAAISAGLPSSVTRSLAGLGAAQLPIAAIAAASVDGVRIGLEDNLWMDADRTTLATNVGLVRRVHSLVDAVGRTVMSPMDARRRLGLKTR